MSLTDNNADNKPASEVQEEGEKVTGGAEATGNNASNADSESPDTTGGEEATPNEDSKKEEVTGYNELPDQAKVGGG